VDHDEAGGAPCPVCGGADVVDTVRRERLPVMQNYVYPTREAALAAPQGRLLVAVCRDCGFAWNREFDPDRLVYDAGYDNTVPSAVMDAHYRETAAYLAREYELDGGLVVDIGCGNGAFLEALCREAPACRGLGVDPALEEDRDDGRIRLLKAAFAPELVPETPSLVVCRHVLEHLPRPVEFMVEIREGVGAAPCYFEVPDLGWILEHGAFQDFCYEHCNYFTPASFGELLRRSGLTPRRARAVFGSQYLGIEASSGEEAAPEPASGPELAESVAAYASSEAERIDSVANRLRRDRDAGRTIGIWGMATKGVVFSVLTDPERSLIDLCLDINANKQGAFVPLTGHMISGPDALLDRAFAQAPLLVVMNENYRDEIERTCQELGVEPTLVSLGEI
jgi:SAM-dependent methyltransferase